MEVYKVGLSKDMPKKIRTQLLITGFGGKQLFFLMSDQKFRFHEPGYKSRSLKSKWQI